MRHRVERFKLNRFTSWRKATLRSLLRSLFIYQRIKTTKTKALYAKSAADRMISLAQKDTLFNRRRAFEVLGDHKLVSFLFTDVAKRFDSAKGGFTRILRLGNRRGDNAQMVILELLEVKKKEKPQRKKKVKEESPEKPATGQEEKAVSLEEKRPGTKVAVQEKPPMEKKPTKKFLGGLRNIFKKERDSL